MFAIYGEQFGIMRLEEDSFASYQEAENWLSNNKSGMEALGNWEIKEYKVEPLSEYPIE